jgi:hypothetical protein
MVYILQVSKDIAKAVDMGATGRLECPHAEYLDWSERRAQNSSEMCRD